MQAHPAPKRIDSIRRHNLAVILSHVHRDGALTRAQLTQRLGVSRSTVGSLVADLTALDVLEEVVPGRGDGVGRPSHTVAPHPDGPFVMAVDLDVARMTCAAVGLGGVVLGRADIDLSSRDTSPPAVAGLVTDAIGPLIEARGLRGRLVGVGVGVPGTVDQRTGRVGVAPNLGWHDVDLERLIGERVPEVAIAVGNDADLAVLAEHQRGEARDSDDVVYLLGRTGFGAGIISSGRPLHGSIGHAGEIGHNVLDASGPPCHCGKRGCMETYVGRSALLRLAGRGDQVSDVAVAGVLDEAARGETRAIRAVRTVADSLGRAIASLLNTLNPQRVVLGGSFSCLLELARPQLEASLDRFALEGPRGCATLSTPTLGADSVLMGAAEIAFADLLSDPVRDPVRAAIVGAQS